MSVTLPAGRGRCSVGSSLATDVPRRPVDRGPHQACCGSRPLRTTVAWRARVARRHSRRVTGCSATREVSCRLDHNSRLIALNVVAAVGYADVARSRVVSCNLVLHVRG